jgi:hypothetical protein
MRKLLSEEQLRLLRWELFGEAEAPDAALEAFQPIRFPSIESRPSEEAAWSDSDPERSERLWRQATMDGEQAAGSIVPAFMHVRTSHGIEVVPEGPFGSCSIWLDLRHPFSRWMVKTNLGSKFGRGKVQTLAPITLSAERAFAYGKAFAGRLTASRVPVIEITVKLD